LARKRPIVGITLGDPAGVGPEIVLGSLRESEVYEKCVPVVIGHTGIMERVSKAARVTAGPMVSLDSPRQAKGRLGVVEVYHVETAGMAGVQPGLHSAAAGAAAGAFIKSACDLGLAGEIDAISTTPINKESLRLAGIEHIGHTEMLAAYLGAANPLTLFITENMRIFFLSRHLSLRDAVDYITEERVYEFIVRVHKAISDIGFRNPKIGMAALNPHASDGGQFGDEEERCLVPAAKRAQTEGINVSLPIGADSVFNMALEGRFDCVLSLYHDQGHIAAKTRDFYGTVTATLNLPVLRTSVDHGTAFDIAWKGIANPVSMKAAIIAAADMVSVRSSGSSTR